MLLNCGKKVRKCLFVKEEKEKFENSEDETSFLCLLSCTEASPSVRSLLA